MKDREFFQIMKEVRRSLAGRATQLVTQGTMRRVPLEKLIASDEVLGVSETFGMMDARDQLRIKTQMQKDKGQQSIIQTFAKAMQNEVEKKKLLNLGMETKANKE